MTAENISMLVADDDRVVRRIVTVKLSGLGYRISEATDGQEVLDRLETGDLPDLVLVDNLMPRVNGMQVVRTLRASARPELVGMPVIMLTSRQSERDIIEGLEAGVDDYISKQFSADELAARVRTVLWRVKRISPQCIVKRLLLE